MARVLFPRCSSARRVGPTVVGCVGEDFQPKGDKGRGRGDDGGNSEGMVSGWTGRFGGFEPIGDQKAKTASSKDPMDSDDFDMFESFAEAEAAKLASEGG